VIPTDGQFVIAATFGEKVYSKIRYFVVVREMQGCCLCLSLNTYNFQGTAKERIRVEDYAAVYPSGGRPTTRVDEQLVKGPFQITVEDAQERLSPMSRLNFGRVYTVEHNVKVLKVGYISDEFLPRFNSYFVETIAGTPTGYSAQGKNAALVSSSSADPLFKKESAANRNDRFPGDGSLTSSNISTSGYASSNEPSYASLYTPRNVEGKASV
jgi:hypothetical protein